MKTDLQKIWILSLAIKLALAAIIPLSADEAYYWVWAQRPQLSYFDHPPFVSWLFTMGDLFLGLGNAVRWPAILMGHLTLLIWILILRPTFDWPKIKVWIYLALFSPLLGFGSLIVTPDIPILFFWSLSIYFTLRAVQNKSLTDYLLLGVALGLGFCSKYHIVLFVPCLIAYLSFDRLWKEVRIKGVLITVFSGLLFCTPVILWNIQNDFASFEFQLKHGLEKSVYDWTWTVTYLLGQVLILFPLIFWAALKAWPAKNIRWALYFGWGPLLFFFLTSFRALVEANWPIIAYPSILALALLSCRIDLFSRLHNFFWGLILALVVASLFIPSIRDLNEKLEEPFLFQQMAQELKDFNPLYSSTYQSSASLWYFRQDPVFKLKDISRIDFFDTFPEATPTVSKFYLVNHKGNGLPTWVKNQQWQIKELKVLNSRFALWEISKP